MLLAVLVEARYTAKLFKQQGELHVADGNVVLLTSLKDYWWQKKQSGKLSEPNGTLVKVSGVKNFKDIKADNSVVSLWCDHKP